VAVGLPGVTLAVGMLIVIALALAQPPPPGQNPPSGPVLVHHDRMNPGLLYIHTDVITAMTATLSALRTRQHSTRTLMSFEADAALDRRGAACVAVARATRPVPQLLASWLREIDGNSKFLD
jgi:hypothetical protein